MKFVSLIIAIIFCLSAIVSGSPIVSESHLMEPHLNVEHKVSTPICSLGSGSAPDYAKISTVTIILEGVGDPLPVEVVFAIDYSNTMNERDPTNKRLIATKEFIKILNNRSDRAGLVYWNGSIIDSRLINFKSEFDDILSKLDKDISGEGVLPEGTTNFDKALNASIDMFDNKTNNTKKCIIFLSDGDPRPPGTYTPPNYQSSPVNRAKEAGIEIWTVGFYNDSLPINETNEARLIEIAQTTGGNYSQSNNLTVEKVFLKIYDQIRGLAGKDIKVEYHAPKDLIYSIDHNRIEGDNKVFIWTPDDLYIGKRWTESFKVSSEKVGLFSLGNAPGSLVSYTTHDLKPENITIEDRQLEVIQCPNLCSPINISVVNITFKPEYIDIQLVGGNFNISSIYNNCTPDSDSEPCEKVICVCVDPTCPECAEVVADNGSKINNINIVQTTIFGSTPFWNGTSDTVGVINLTVRRPEAVIDAVFAFDVSGSMRLPYERMSEVARAAFAESNFSNVSIIGWDEDDGAGADRLMVPPRPLMESEEEVLAALANLSRRCDETDQTVYASGLEGVLGLDDKFGELFGGDGKIVLFITASDEFRPGEDLELQENELKRRGYAIYTIGVEIDEIESPLKYDNLSRMANLTGGQFYTIGGLDFDELREVLRSVKAHSSSKAAPKDIVVMETLPADMEVKETVPSGPEVDVVDNLDGTSTLTWTASGVKPGEARSLIILTNVKGVLPPDGINATSWPGGIDIRPTGGDAAGVNVINMRTENGDVKIGEIA